MSESKAVLRTKSSSRALNITLWVAQLIVALFFVWAGGMKLMTPINQLAAMWPWTGELPAGIVRFLGAIDLAGGIGVLLPALTRIKPRLTVLAALGLVVLQICAVIFHASRGEFPALPFNAVLIVFCAFVLWGRSKKIPFQARSST
ncbi:DoxX family protein [Variovorax sp. Root411]|uniref:DoxX family protein n=1 Tax=Variovorax sp. Root411 TaxID=1736530 RepID=UPI0009E8B901|nr:DoxX family protein [Variovorax sp. Root411]